MSANRRIVPQDNAGAVKWYRKAAEQGHAEAQFKLGAMCFSGDGVLQDDAGAVKWYRMAAEQGHAEAQDDLGYMYENGLGVPQDDAEAEKWHWKAAEQGNAEAQYNLGILAKQGDVGAQNKPGIKPKAVKSIRIGSDGKPIPE
jgi:TPR repeat protein